MFITESKLKKIIHEEYTRLIEGDVVQGRFGGASQDGGTEGSGEAISFADRRGEILRKKKKQEFNKQVVEFNKTIGTRWGEINKKYNDMYNRLEKKKSIPGEVINISPGALKNEKKRIIAEKRAQMTQALKEEKVKAHKIDSSIVPHVGALLSGIEGSDGSGKIDGLARQTKANLKLGMEKFLEGWYTAQGVRYTPVPLSEKGNPFYETSLDYFHYYEGQMKTFHPISTFVKGRRDPELFPPKEPTPETPATEVPTKKPSHLSVVKQ